MLDYRIGSFTRPGESLDAAPIVVYFARLPRGGDVSGDLDKIIAAVEFDLQQLAINADAAKLSLWLEHFAAMAEIYETSRIHFEGSEFLYAQIFNGFLDTDLLAFDNEEEFVNALNLPYSSYDGG